MTADRRLRWPSLAVLAGSAAAIALMVVAVVRYPGMVGSKGAAVFLLVAGVLVAVWRPPAPMRTWVCVTNRYLCLF